MQLHFLFPSTFSTNFCHHQSESKLMCRDDRLETVPALPCVRSLSFIILWFFISFPISVQGLCCPRQTESVFSISFFPCSSTLAAGLARRHLFLDLTLGIMGNFLESVCFRGKSQHQRICLLKSFFVACMSLHQFDLFLLGK